MPPLDRVVNPDVTNSVLAKAAQTAGSIEHNNRQLGQQTSATDVWKHGREPLVERVQTFASDPAAALAGYQKDFRRGVEKSLDGDWASSSKEQWIDSAIAQQDALGGQVEAIGKADGALAKTGATFALLTSVEQMVSTSLSTIPFPAFPALRVSDMDVGLPHAHNHPPNLTPAGLIPLPSTGPVIPIPLLSGANQTLINGMPAARCGDMGLGIWCGGYFPMFEVFFGSSNVWIEGARAARMAVDLTNHCIFSSRQKGGEDTPIGPMIGTTITGSPNVSVGGVPMPSLLSLAMGKAFQALFRGLGKAVGALRKTVKRLRNGRPRLRGFEPGQGPADWEIVKKAADPDYPLSPFAEDLHRRLKDTANMTPKEANIIFSRYPKTRIPLGPDGINADDLVDLTRRTGLEHAVVVDEAGELKLLRGGPNEVVTEPGDHVLVHTHPINTPPSPGDIHMAQQQRAAAGDSGEHTGAVLGHDGSTKHYDHTGEVAEPTATPVDPNSGQIYGLYRDPNTGEVTTAPPNWQRQ